MGTHCEAFSKWRDPRDVRGSRVRGLGLGFRRRV